MSRATVALASTCSMTGASAGPSVPAGDASVKGMPTTRLDTTGYGRPNRDPSFKRIHQSGVGIELAETVEDMRDWAHRF
jgi:hypothetical protein